MSVTIDQLLAAVGAAGAAAAEYARVDAAREAALAAANARVAALEAELAATPPRADAGPAPVPVITASRTAVMAGLPVWVHAMDSTLGVGQPHQAVYAWGFGDPKSKFNSLRGFNAAHIYDQPGTYTITLTVTNSGGSSATASQVVTVKAAKVNPISRLEDAKSGCRNVLTVPMVKLTALQ